MNFVGTAGWSLPRAIANEFPQEGTHLERYAQALNCAEINSSFYRSHSRETYRRWANATPANFKFAVKMPRAITHDARLLRIRVPLEQFLSEIKGLGKKLGPLLVQLPPSLSFDVRATRRFFTMLRELHRGAVVCEPRHKSWFEPRAESVLIDYRISRVAADPAINAVAAQPGGAIQRLVYYRLHGSPRIYWSDYSRQCLLGWATETKDRSKKISTWFIFDNTASGCATANALQLRAMLKGTDL